MADTIEIVVPEKPGPELVVEAPARPRRPLNGAEVLALRAAAGLPPHKDRYRHPEQADRVQHWATRAFHDFLKERARAPFAWGSQDCALFAADGILAITGVDVAADFRGKYADEAGALEAIKTVCGGATVEDAAAWCAAKHNLPEWLHAGRPAPLLARRGDLVVLEDPDGVTPGRLIAGLVHLSGRHIVAAGELGLKRISISAVKRAWHV